MRRNGILDPAPLKRSSDPAPRLLCSNGRGTKCNSIVSSGGRCHWAVVCFSCGGSTSNVGGLVQTGAAGAGSQPGDAGATGTGGSHRQRKRRRTGTGGGGGGGRYPLACADIFDQGSLQTYSFDISDDQMAAINVEFHNVTALESGADFAVYHPITFHLNGETVTRRRHQAARPVVVGSDRHARRRPRQDAVRRVVQSGQPQGFVPRRQ